MSTERQHSSPRPLFLFEVRMESITVSSEDVSDLAQTVMKALIDDEALYGESVCACAVVMGRLMAPREINSEEEMKFMQDIIEWAGLYWSGLDKGSN